MSIDELINSVDPNKTSSLEEKLKNLPKRDLTPEERKAQAISWTMSCMKDKSDKTRKFVETEFAKRYG
ncbi:MAG: hypothetical protein OXC62_15180 [Aestuariivita sp.]|nr:hypothetical protein [Aestuariivita sp.]